MRFATAAGACAVLAVAGWAAAAWGGSPAGPLRPMSFHNRVLLNRAAVSGLESIEVMLLASGDRMQSALNAIGARVSQAGGRVRRTEEALGYLRVEVPTARLMDIVPPEDVEAYQIASLSRAAWYRDTPPMSNAEMYRGFEKAASGGAPPDPRYASLPPLPAAAARDRGLTGDDDVGLDEWKRAHPTFDGRGVTIALLESAQPAFLDPTLGPAKRVDGADIPKIAGILNAIDPDQPDATRVSLDTTVEAATAWVRIGDRTYVVPHAGAFRFGLFTLPAGGNLVHRFGVLRDEATGEVRVDTNGNADFSDEAPVPDVNERFEPGVLKLRHPAPVDLGFVVGRGRAPHALHVYAALGSHQAMTLSVAAGRETDGGLASGVAPGARVLLVRNTSSGYRLADLVESYIDASRHPDVDIVNASAGFALVPDTAAAFAGLLFRRAMAVYGKPIIDAAGNRQLWLASASARGPLMSAGGSLGPNAFAALYGGAALDRIIVHPAGAAGPAIDGAIKPDFLAPMERLSADLPWNSGVGALPLNAPVHRVPPGYQISCCTSASSPYAAGVAALLLSGVRQRGLSSSTAALGRAMRMGARFIPGFQSHEQGNGVLDVNAAWRELTHPLDLPRIVSSARIVHPLARYAPGGSTGEGILEVEGWSAGMEGRREITLRRESGSPRPVAYRLSWTGNDGTFASPASVTLPLDAAVTVPIRVRVATPGTHSAILNLHEPSADRIVFRTQAAVVATERGDPSTGVVRMSGRVGVMRSAAHYVHVPPGVTSLGLDLEVTRGVIRVAIVPGHGLYPAYYHHVHPGITRLFGKGRYSVSLPNPGPGTWGIHVTNDSLSLPVDARLASGDEAEYALTTGVRRAVLRAAEVDGSLRVDVSNLAGALREPVIHVSPASIRTHRGVTLANGLPNLVEISVPKGTATLGLQLKAPDARGASLELFLYDCTSGECFSYDLAFPAARTQTMTVRQPTEGRWIAAVNAAPLPNVRDAFVLEEILAAEPDARSARSHGPALPGKRWTETLPAVPRPEPRGDRTGGLFVELLDVAVERGESDRPWDPRPGVTPLRNSPISHGSTFHPFK